MENGKWKKRNARKTTKTKLGKKKGKRQKKPKYVLFSPVFVAQFRTVVCRFMAAPLFRLTAVQQYAVKIRTENFHIVVLLFVPLLMLLLAF